MVATKEMRMNYSLRGNFRYSVYKNIQKQLQGVGLDVSSSVNRSCYPDVCSNERHKKIHTRLS